MEKKANIDFLFKIVIMVFLGIFAVNGCTSEKQNINDIGDKIIISKGYVYTSLDAADEFMDAMNAKDDYGVNDLISSGRMIRINNPVNARVLNYRSFREMYEVRILSGAQEGGKVYVYRKNVDSLN